LHQQREELLRRELGQLRGEGEDTDGIEPKALKQLDPLFERGEVGDGRSRADDGAGVRVEGEGDRGEPLRPRAFEQDGDEVLVPAVDAVEDADGDAARPARRDAR